MKKGTVWCERLGGLVIAILVNLLCVYGIGAAPGPWVGPIDPGGGGQVVDIEVDADNHDRLFVLINSGGLRRSTDGGQTWTIHNLDMNYEAFGFKATKGWFIGLHPENQDVLLRSTRQGDIYLSADGGDTWDISYSVGDVSAKCKLGDFTYDPDDPNVVYTACGGMTNIACHDYKDKECGDNRIVRGVYDPDTGRYRWTVLLDDMGALETEWVYSMDVCKEGGRTYLYLTAPYGLYKGELVPSGNQLRIQSLESLNASPGLPAPEYLEGSKVVVDDQTPGRIYLTVGNRANLQGGVYRSEDYGEAFYLLTDPSGYDPLQSGQWNTRFFELAVSPSNPNTLYACMVRYRVLGERRNGTLMRSTDDGATWLPMMLLENMQMGWKDYNAKQSRFSVNRIAPSVHNKRVFYAATVLGAHLFRSGNADDAHPEWKVKSTAPQRDGSPSTWSGGYPAIGFQWSIAVNPLDPNMIIVPYSDHGIFVSEDGGRSMGLWVEHGPGGIGETLGGTLLVDRRNPSVWYYALQGPHMKVNGRVGDGAVIRFSDYGGSWAYLGGDKDGPDQGFPRGPACDMLIEHGANGNTTVYVANYNTPLREGGVYQKTNDEPFTRIFKKANVRAIAQRDDFSCLFVGADGRGLFKLTRKASRWARKRIGSAGKGLCGNTFYAMKTGHESGRIYCATDIGLVAIDRNDRLVMLRQGSHYWDVAINPRDEDILYVVSDHGEGVLRSTDRGLTWSNVSQGLPSLNTMRLAVDPRAPDTIYVGTKSAGIWKRSF